MVKNVPRGMAPGSDTANLSVLGYDPKIYYSGRSPLEALNIGVDMQEGDVAIRANLVTLTQEENYEDKRILDHSADEITTEEAPHPRLGSPSTRRSGGCAGTSYAGNGQAAYENHQPEKILLPDLQEGHLCGSAGRGCRRHCGGKPRRERNDAKQHYHCYSLDASPGIEHHFPEQVISPEDILMEKETEREQEAARALMMERLREALATLTPRQASCLHARFWEGKQFKEIAEAEGFTTSAAIVTVRNAIIKLQKYYIKRGWMKPPKEESDMHKDNTAQAKQKKDEREEVLKEIRQLENRQKILENKQRNEERKARTAA